MFEENAISRPWKYSRISLKKREKLVDLVLNQSVSICRAAKKLGIKNSTAKLIIKRFKTDQTFFQSRRMKEQRLMKQQEQRQERQRLIQIEKQAHTFFFGPIDSTNTVTLLFNYFDPFAHWNCLLMPLNYLFVPLT